MAWVYIAIIVIFLGVIVAIAMTMDKEAMEK